MPGLTGWSSPRTQSTPDARFERLQSMEHALYPERRLDVERRVDTDPSFHCLVHGRAPWAGVAQRGDAVLAFEGYVFRPSVDGDSGNGADDGDALATMLLDRFLDHGERFAETLRGSFQIVVRRGDATYLYVDPVASRRLFYSPCRDLLLFSPEVAPLTAELRRCGVALDLDPADLVQFLICGRFFAGETPWKQIRQLLPGEYLVARNGEIERRFYHRYEIAANEETFDLEETLQELEARLERAVLDSWSCAKNPTFLLSGGYDSRFLFYTVARALGDASQINTVIWGEDPDREESDTWVSTRIAERFGTRHLVWDWGVERIPDHFDDLFRAQSGTTDFAFTHVDEFLHCRTLRDEYGIDAIFRGDEIFGPQKAEVDDADAAMERMALRRRCPAEGASCLLDGGRDQLRAHAERIDRLLEEAPKHPPDLRDTFYARERLPTFQQQLNYYRSHTVEMFNPLTDAAIVELYATVPAQYRWDKRLFKTVFQRQFGEQLREHPIAVYGNPIDWPKALRNTPRTADFLRQGLKELPAPFHPTHGLDLLDGVLRGDRPPANGEIPPERLLMRMLILGRWIREV